VDERQRNYAKKDDPEKYAADQRRYTEKRRERQGEVMQDMMLVEAIMRESRLRRGKLGTASVACLP
jgi:hypothetical protein